MAGSRAHVPGAPCTYLAAARVSNKDPVPQILGLCVLTNRSAASDEGDANTAAIVVALTPAVASPSPPAEVTSGDINGWCLPPLHFSLFPPLRARH